MNNADRARMRCDVTIAVKFPAIVRDAIERAAERDYRSLSEIIRQTMVDRLRADGLLDDQATPTT